MKPLGSSWPRTLLNGLQFVSHRSSRRRRLLSVDRRVMFYWRKFTLNSIQGL